MVLDIDECAPENRSRYCDSQATCSNANGSYACNCHTGYETNNYGVTCTGEFQLE